MVKLNNDWDDILKNEFEKEYYLILRKKLKTEYKNYTIYPDMGDIFNSLRLTPYRKARVVILGQDPYHQKGQAHGLCFSVKRGVEPPPSLKNIFKELESDVGMKIPKHGNLESWAKQGVLLLNTILTVREGCPNSHKEIGWFTFTNEIIKILNKKETPVIFLLWGNNAVLKESLITNSQHILLKSAHPSPFSASRGFFGCRHFSKVNEFLKSQVEPEIKWQT